MLTRPDQWQITDGVTFNTLIPFVNDLATKGIMGPTIPLDPNYVKLLNVTVGTDGPKVAFLKEGQQLDWPFVLQGPKQENLDTLVKHAALETANGKLQAKTYDAIFPLREDLRATNKKRWQKEEIATTPYLDGNHFLDKIETAVKSLAKPGAKRFLDGTYSAKGNTVPELAFNITNSGLKFAPCNPGDEDRKSV